MFPLSCVLFPGAALPLHVFEPRYRALTADCLAGEREFGVVLITRGAEVGGGDERVDIGTVARIERAMRLPDGRWMLLTTGAGRVRVVEWLPDDPYPLAVVEDIEERGVASGAAREALPGAAAAVRKARGLLSELGQVPAPPVDLDLSEDLNTASWQLCAMAPLTPFDGMRLLRHNDVAARLGELHELCGALATDLRRLLEMGPS